MKPEFLSTSYKERLFSAYATLFAWLVVLFFLLTHSAKAVSPVQESFLRPNSFIQESTLKPSFGKGVKSPAITVEEDPGVLLVNISGIRITDNSSKLKPKGIPLPDTPENRVTVDLSLGFAYAGKPDTEGSLEKRSEKIKQAILSAGFLGQSLDTRNLTMLAELITQQTGGLVVFPDQDSTNGMVQALIIGTTTTASVPIIGAITVTDEGEGSQVIADPLKGIALIENSESMPDSPSEGLSISPKLALTSQELKHLERHLGQPATVGTLRKMSREIVTTYRKNGMPIVHVTVPDQDIASGVVVFKTVEAKIGEIDSEGENWTSAERIKDAFRKNYVQPGKILRQSYISAAMDDLNATGFRQANTVLTPGEEYGESNVTVHIHHRFPVRAFWSWDNTGTESLDTERWSSGFSWSEPFGLPHVFSYQFRGAPDTDRYSAHSGSYQMWLPWWNHRMTLYGTYAENMPSANLAGLDLMGESILIGGTYTVPLKTFLTDDDKISLEHNATFSFDYKDSNTDLTFAGVQVFQQKAEVAQFTFGYNATLYHNLGYSKIKPALTYSPGGLFSNNSTASFQNQRAGAEPDYQVFTLDWEHSFPLPKELELNLSGHYQYATENLIGTEQMSLGGARTIRGFPEQFTSGDEGYYFRNELRAPPLAIAHLAGFTTEKQDELVFYGFFDYGEIGPCNYNPASTIEDHTLASAGAGFRYHFNTYLSMDLSYGFRILTPNVNNPGGSALKYSFTLAY